MLMFLAVMAAAEPLAPVETGAPNAEGSGSDIDIAAADEDLLALETDLVTSASRAADRCARRPPP